MKRLFVVLTLVLLSINDLLAQFNFEKSMFGNNNEITPSFQIPKAEFQNDSPAIILKPYTKDLERKAKDGDAISQVEVGKCYLWGSGIDADDKKAQKWFEMAIEQNNVDALFWIGYMCEKGKIKKTKLSKAFEKYSPKKACEKAAKEFYDKAAISNQPDALYWQYCNARKKHELFTEHLIASAEGGNIKAQYEWAAINLAQFNSSQDNISSLLTAKEWFTKAAKHGHPDASRMVSGIEEVERQIEVAKQEKEKEAQKEAIEMARNDSIEKLQAAQQSKRDSIDYATGIKMLPYRSLITDCEVYQDDQTSDIYFYEKIAALSKDDVPEYYGRAGLDGLDRELYKKSEQFKIDQADFQKRKQKKYAIIEEIGSHINKFEADGMSLYGPGSIKLDQYELANYYIDVKGLFFPIQQIRTKDQLLKFKSKDLDLMQKIRYKQKDLAYLLIFKPSSYVQDGNEYFYITHFLSLYLVDKNTGETLMDLSKYIRKTTIQAEKQRVLAAIKKYDLKRKANAPKKHSTPQQARCLYCGGKGYVEYFNGTGIRTKSRCTNCYGQGYTLEYYY